MPASTFWKAVTVDHANLLERFPHRLKYPTRHPSFGSKSSSILDTRRSSNVPARGACSG